MEKGVGIEEELDKSKEIFLNISLVRKSFPSKTKKKRRDLELLLLDWVPHSLGNDKIRGMVFLI